MRMAWAEEGPIVDRAVNEMRKAGVPVTPARVEHWIAERGAAALTDLVVERVNALCAKTNHEERSNTMERQYADVLPALLARNLDPNKVPETQADADALESERRELISGIQSGSLDAGERAKAAQRIQKVEELLARWRNGGMDAQAGRTQVRNPVT